jgi:glycine cleavage system transcriptional repressor
MKLCVCHFLISFLSTDSGYFSVSGADNPGIVHKVTSVLAKHGLSIDKVRTAQEIAPHGGTTLFLMEGTANAPDPLAKEFDADKIKAELEELGNFLNCDVSMLDAHDESIQSSFYGG